MEELTVDRMQTARKLEWKVAPGGVAKLLQSHDKTSTYSRFLSVGKEVPERKSISTKDSTDIIEMTTMDLCKLVWWS